VRIEVVKAEYVQEHKDCCKVLDKHWVRDRRKSSPRRTRQMAKLIQEDGKKVKISLPSPTVAISITVTCTTLSHYVLF
jgi:hypothetical protein